MTFIIKVHMSLKMPIFNNKLTNAACVPCRDEGFQTRRHKSPTTVRILATMVRYLTACYTYVSTVVRVHGWLPPTGIDAIVLLLVIGLLGCSDIRFKPCKARSCMFGVF